MFVFFVCCNLFFLLVIFGLVAGEQKGHSCGRVSGLRMTRYAINSFIKAYMIKRDGFVHD